MINLLRTFTCHWGSIFSSFVELSILANSLWTLQWEKISQGERERIIFQHLSMYKYHVTIGRSSKSGSWLEWLLLSQIWWQNSGFPLFEKVLSWIFYLPFKLCYWFNYSTLFVISKRKCLKGAPDILRLLPFNLPL